MKDREVFTSGDNVHAISSYLDKNVRVVKNIPYILAGIGLALIARYRVWFHRFQSVKNIPHRAINGNYVLKGNLKKVARDLTLFVEHIPKIQVRYFPWAKPNNNELLVRIAGIKVSEEYQKNVHSYLTQFENQEIKIRILDRGSHQLGENQFVNLGVMKPLRPSYNKGQRSDVVTVKNERRNDVESEQVLHCVVWTKKKKWSIRRTFFNFELLKMGLAQAQPLPSTVRKSSTKLSEKLHKNERVAIKKRLGIWHGPSNFNILISSIKEKPSELVDQGKLAAKNVYELSRINYVMNFFRQFQKKAKQE